MQRMQLQANFQSIKSLLILLTKGVKTDLMTRQGLITTDTGYKINGGAPGTSY
jgi:hypothetical protein